ncbi:MAG: helix-turn-helix transcriptional regulator [Pseudomonadota bacterium]
MNNDSIFGERLKAERKRLKLSQSTAGELAGVSREMWYKYEKGAMPGGDVMLAIERAGFNMEYLFTSKENSEPKIDSAKSSLTVAAPEGFILVPHYEVHASAGNGALVHSEQIVDYLAFKDDWVRNTLGVPQKELALISVKGDSMEPTLSNEDLILIDMRKSRVEDNAIYVLQLDGTLLVKRIQRKLDGSLHVMSDNARYQPEIVNADRSGDLHVLGRVVWSGRRM